jgi:hypothetical protein
MSVQYVKHKRLIYLDTSTLQKLYDFGEEIFEDQPFEPIGRAAIGRTRTAPCGQISVSRWPAGRGTRRCARRRC